MHDVAPRYPDICLQTLTSSWWVEDGPGEVSRGRLIWTLVPYPEMKPHRLLPIGRGSNARQHSTADYRLETFRVGDSPRGVATLPVAALPIRDGESLMVARAKRRPSVVVSTGGPIVPAPLRQGANRWHVLPMAPLDQSSVLRLDHIMPIGADPTNWTIEPWVLSDEALGLLDDALRWLTTGVLTDASALGYARIALGEL